VLIDRISLAVNTFLLGRFVSPAGLGQYRYAQRFAMLPQDITTTGGSYVLFPALARIAPEKERFDRAFERSLRWLLIGVVPLSLLLVPLGEPLAVLLLGNAWRPAGQVLMLLGLAAAPNVIGSTCAESLKAAGRPDVLPRLHLISGVLTVVLMLVFVPLGLRGIAAGVVLAAVAADAVTLQRTIRVQMFDRALLAAAVWPPFVAGAISAALLLAVDRLWVDAGSRGVAAGLGLLALEALVGVAVYIACLLPLSSPTRDELGRVLRRARGR
jgi:PST family polysaccharide transporter